MDINYENWDMYSEKAIFNAIGGRLYHLIFRNYENYFHFHEKSCSRSYYIGTTVNTFLTISNNAT